MKTNLAFDHRWLTQNVIDLASTIYHNGPPFAMLPILGDALMDAGCDSELVSLCMEQRPKSLVGLWDREPHIEWQINCWLDADPSLWQVREMLAEWYWHIGSSVEAEAYEWLAAGRKWPEINVAYYIRGWVTPDSLESHDGTDRNYRLFILEWLGLESAGYLQSELRSAYFELSYDNGSRHDHETRFVEFWRLLSDAQRKEMWEAIK